MEKTEVGYEIPESVKELMNLSASLYRKTQEVVQTEKNRLVAYSEDVPQIMEDLNPLSHVSKSLNDVINELASYVSNLAQCEMYGKADGKGSL